MKICWTSGRFWEILRLIEEIRLVVGRNVKKREERIRSLATEAEILWK